MSPAELILLCAAAAAAGVLNAVAGGGSFLTFPALLFAGIAPIPANATSSAALWPGSVASSAAYRRELRAEGRWAAILALPSIAGGIGGAVLLVRTPESVFARLIPFLMLAAALLFTFAAPIHRFVTAWGAARRLPSSFALFAGLCAQLAISVYGGYFGGGMGFMMLASFALLGIPDVHRMNAVKSLMAVLINGAAVAAFAFAGIIRWQPAAVMIAAAVAGGFGGAALARRVAPEPMRRAVAAIGWLITGWFFWRAYGS